jgi:hypothetical protein
MLKFSRRSQLGRVQIDIVTGLSGFHTRGYTPHCVHAVQSTALFSPFHFHFHALNRALLALKNMKFLL